MQQPRSGRRRPRALAALAILVVFASLLCAPGQAAAKPPPVNPTDNQISAAQQRKIDTANEVGRLSAQTAQMQTRLDRLTADQQLAEQKLALALSRLAAAKIAATQALKNVTTARKAAEKAQRDFVGYLQASYTSGDVGGTTGTLLTAHDPNVLLESGALHDYQASHQVSAIGNLERATVARSNADAAARNAVALQAALTHAADVAKDRAIAALEAGKRQKAQLESALAAKRTLLHQRQLELATYNNQRAQFVAYQQEQARIAAARAAELERRRQEAIAAAAARAAAAAAAAAAADAANSNDGGGGGGGGSYVPPGPTGNWTPAAGRRAADRALQWLGTPYSFAAGNASGPTYGVCTNDAGFNDCHVFGFDCSGLVMYAWAQFPFVHFAATQYLQGSVHPDVSSLMPGDLVFWSGDGTVNGIGHVAIYIGGGNVVQAPQSGDIVRITPLDQVESGYYGATRPLT
ncbi:MAG: NlpC/P60 family protein [Pseudonocardiales bacterium]